MNLIDCTYVFRGQSNYKHELLPSAFRPSVIKSRDESFLREFSHKKIQFEDRALEIIIGNCAGDKEYAKAYMASYDYQKVFEIIDFIIKYNYDISRFKHASKDKRTIELQGFRPPSEIAKARRANYEGEPVFYGCDQQRGTFFETTPGPNKLLVVSEWEVIAPFVVTYLGQTHEVFGKFNATSPVPLVPSIEAYPPICQEVNGFLDTLFTEKNEDNQANAYKVSAAIAKQLMYPIHYQDQNIFLPSGIAYPTLAMHANANNYAFPTKLADECLRLSGAHCYRVLDHDGPTFSYGFDFLWVMESNIDGNIEWREPTEEEKLRQREICVSSQPNRIYNPYQVLRRLNISNIDRTEAKDTP